MVIAQKKAGPFNPLNEFQIREMLCQLTGERVHLRLTNNRRVFLSFKRVGSVLNIRLHEIFLRADAEVLGAISDFTKDKRSSLHVIRAFIKENSGEIPSAKRLKGSPVGQVYNLRQIFDELNKVYFQGRLKSEISWGRVSNKRRVKRRTLGTYNRVHDAIRINRILDSSRVPLYYVGFVIYHEMLHADIGVDRGLSRRMLHTTEFKGRERLYHDYQRAIKWERENL